MRSEFADSVDWCAGAHGMRRLLVLTVACTDGPIELPLWLTKLGRTDAFVLNPFGYQLERPLGFSETELREILVYSGKTGFKSPGELHFFVNSHNEELRRGFRDLLRWGSWDALVLNGAWAALPILGDNGLDVPRGLSWLVYRETADDREKLAEEAKWHDFSAKKFRSFHSQLLRKAAETVRENAPTFQAPPFVAPSFEHALKRSAG